MTKSKRPPGADPFDLARFTAAQAGTYSLALGELRAGRKESHWMWFIFPQFEGLGFSSTSRRYAIRSLDEARAYLAHPVLGPRLVECSEALLAHTGLLASDIFGAPDDLKLRSSMTLFELAAAPGSVFTRVLERFFDGERDAATLRLVGRPRDRA
ncbi:MAG: DUF1810 domain-containing protein [Acidobacteria bacterium]|nr:MAG: DUF1810 domain-containing protein [Acidobacteriota bacterium]